MASAGGSPSGVNKSGSRKLWPATLVVAAVGFGVIALIFANRSTESRPQIAASFNPKTEIVTVEAAGSNLSADRSLRVNVDLQTIEAGQGVDDPRPWNPRGSLPLGRAYVGPNSDGNAESEVSVPVLVDSVYTHIVIEATTEPDDDSCIELAGGVGLDEHTACMFIPLGIAG